MHNRPFLVRWWAFVALVTLAALIGGCGAQSVNPLASDEVTAVDDGFIGVWDEDDGKLAFTVTSPDAGRHAYHVTINKKGEGAAAGLNEMKLDCILADVNGHRYADLTTAEANGEALEKLGAGFVIPVHQFVGVKREGDSLSFWMVDAKYLKDPLGRKELTLDHTLVEEKDLLLTASTRDLQAFFGAHARDRKLFPEETKLHRRVTPDKPAPGK